MNQRESSGGKHSEVSEWTNAATQTPDHSDLLNLGPDFPYRIVREIGGGGMGVVFLGLDRRSGREVAIKTLRKEYRTTEELVRRFGREVRVMADLEHPNVIRVITFDMNTSPPWVAMEYCRAGSVADVPQDVDARALIRLFLQACDGISFGHSQGVLHRDIKPGNLLIGNDGLVKVSDFGLAVMLDRDSTPLTPTGLGIGTLGFSAPEQIANAKSVTAAADVYSLGVTLYVLLTGALPGAHLYRPELVKGGLTGGERDEVFRLIDSCIERQPSDRPESVAVLRAHLASAMGEARDGNQPPETVDADAALQLIMKLAGQLREDEILLLKRVQSGEQLHATHELRDNGMMYDSPNYSVLHGLQRKGLITFHEQDYSGGKWIRGFHISDVALNALGAAILRYIATHESLVEDESSEGGEARYDHPQPR